MAMKNVFRGITIGFASLLLVLSFPHDSFARMFKFSGGPSGGTFQYYASAISTLAKKNKVNVLSSSSGGSIENIRLTNSGKTNFSVAYSGHVFQARNGMMKGDAKKYENVLAVAYFYGAPAQLIVREGSGITSAKQLVGKRVGVGNAGSGAAANAELFFSELGIWDKIDRNFLGYRQAAGAFGNKQLDAFWVFVGFPNASVIEAALQNKIALVDVYKDAEDAGVFKKYPYFKKITIPADTYKGVSKPTNTFQDSTLWVANSKVDADTVYNLLKAVFSKEGLAYMVSVHKSAKAMSVKNGLNGVVTPMHPGAEKFWKEKGVLK
jgi:TRAP transporter TAXI family solute receptor